MCIQGHFKYLAFLNSHFCTLSPPYTHPLPSHLLPSQNSPPSLSPIVFFPEWMNDVPASVSLVLASAPLWNNLLFYMNYHMKAANVILLQLCFMLQNCKWYRAVHICPVSGNNPSPSSPFLLFVLHCSGKYCLLPFLCQISTFTSINICYFRYENSFQSEILMLLEILGHMGLILWGWNCVLQLGSWSLETSEWWESLQTKFLNFNTAQQHSRDSNVV